MYIVDVTQDGKKCPPAMDMGLRLAATLIGYVIEK